MIYRPLGATDIDVSILGLGTVKLGRNLGVKYPNAFTIPDDKHALEILNTAKNCGITLIDTAPAYGNSESRLGKLLPLVDNDWVICTKVGEYFNSDTGESFFDFSPEAIEKSLESSLKKLKRDVLDIVLIHSNGDDESIIREGALEVLEYYKKKGWLHATGMSTKTVAGGLLACEQSDVVMVTHNLSYSDELPVIRRANILNKGVLIKKAFASGHLNQTINEPVGEAFKEIFKHEGISSINFGSIAPKHIIENTQKALNVFDSP